MDTNRHGQMRFVRSQGRRLRTTPAIGRLKAFRNPAGLAADFVRRADKSDDDVPEEKLSETPRFSGYSIGEKERAEERVGSRISRS